MFENDRFGPHEDYFTTYQELGGSSLTRRHLHKIIDKLVIHMSEMGKRPSQYDSFPSVPEALTYLQIAANLDSKDIPRIEDLVSRHEVGSISERHANAIHTLSSTHRLGILSNIWGRKHAFEDNLREAGVFNCFEHIVWSSQHGSIKPSPKLFHHALSLFQVSPTKVLFVGDHPYRDIAGAAACGCSSVWIQNDDESFPRNCSQPTLTITHLEDLLDA